MTPALGNYVTVHTPKPLDLVDRNFSPLAPDRLWVADFERHEALLNRAVVKGHRLRLVAASRES